MLSKLFEALYPKVFVNIIGSGTKSVVYIEVCNKNEVISNAEESFISTLEHKKMLEFIQSYTNETPFHYISYLDHSPLQGALCRNGEKSKRFDLSLFKYINYNKEWLYYTSKSELNLLKKRYADAGVDYIFSPFVLLAEFFKDKLDSEMTMFVLVEESYITLSIFNKGELLFAEHISIEHKTISEDDDTQIKDIDDFELDDMSIDLDDIDVNEEVDELDEIIEELDELESLDDLSDIEDLDSMEDIEEFSEDEDMQYSQQEDVSNDLEPQNINDNYKIFAMIQSSINNFYSDTKVNSEFVETVYIADGVGSSQDLKQYLEEEMFLSVYVRRVDLCVEICELAKLEH